ncbi:MAG: insulinase family protein [Lachnospiraceae bacterium]|nr:insulinase family protein [Lachnospiraceae bacterium]
MKKLSKLLAFLLAFALIVGSFGTGSGLMEAYADETPMLISTRLEVGSKVHGFTLKEMEKDESVNGYYQIWEHDKTGAQTYLIINNDPERAFGILFKTEPEDDTGKLHILEHASCAASVNYPGRDVFFDLSTQGFITDINATTYHSSTNYYVSSLDEQELMNGADFYLDCAFNSVIRNDRRYFDREGWRYVIGSADDPLDVTGIVYNEMKGTLSNIDSFTFDYAMKHLYPDSNYQYISGGVPEKILDLTYEDLIEFYDKCYHPSNCTAIVYGDIDYNSWLEEFDSYFGKYEREEIAAPEKYVPKGDLGTVTEYFPVTADSEDLSGRLLYIWDLPDELTYAEYNALSMLGQYENEVTSPIMQTLNASGIGSGYGLYVNDHGDQKQFLAYAFDADTSRADEFKKIVDDEFAAILRSTIDKETIDCMFESWALSEALAFNTSGIGVNVISSFTKAIEAQDIEGMILDSELDKKIKKIFDDEKAIELFEQNVVNNNNKLLYIVTPKPGLAEENEAALAKKLADKKASLSKKEIKKLVADSNAFDQWNQEGGTVAETVAKLVTADPAKLDTSAPSFDTKIVKKNGVIVESANIEGDVSFYRYSFDISNLSKTQVKYLNEYVNYLGLATTTRTQEQVTNDSRKYLSNFSAQIAVQTIDGKEIPSLVVSFYAFNNKIEQALDLVFDMLYNTDLDNAYNVSFIAQMSSYSLSTYSDPSNLSNLITSAAGASTDTSYALSWKLNGKSRYDFLKKAVASENNFMKMLAGMASVRKKIVKRQNATVRVVGSKASRSASVKAMLARLPKKNKTYKSGSIMTVFSNYKDIKNFAIEMNTQAVFLTSIYMPETIDTKTVAAEMMAMAIMQDVMYIPEFRFSLGAYGGYCGTNSDGMLYAQLYRSPEFTNSWQRILETPDELEAILTMITDEDIEGYKLSLLSNLITPQGEWTTASVELYYIASGDGTDPKYAVAKAIQDLTVEDMAAALPQIRKAFENLGTAVVAGSEEIAANKDKFDKIYKFK